MKLPPPPPLLSITTSLPLLGLNRVTFGACTRPGTNGMTVNEISHFPSAISNSPESTRNVEKNYLTLTFFTYGVIYLRSNLFVIKYYKLIAY